MNNFSFVHSVREATIDLPLSSIDIPTWLFSLPDATYQSCSPDHIACGSGHDLTGKRMSLNVEVIGGNMMVQHYVEEIAEPARCRMHSVSDLFLPGGRTTLIVAWEMSAVYLSDHSSTFTNRVEVKTNDDFLNYLRKHNMAIDSVTEAIQKATDIHNAHETPHFAKSIQAWVSALATA